MQAFFEDVTAIPAITTLALLAAQIVKSFTPLDSRRLPAFCGSLGAILGIVCYIWIPQSIPADNALMAAVTGAVSGWAATGIHQTRKQMEE